MSRTTEQRAKRKAYAIGYLGGHCTVCDSTDNLEFDHIDETTKIFNIGGNLLKSEKELVSELDKCQLLCHDCHLTKTLAHKGHNRATHGTYTMYNNHKCRCKQCRLAWAAYYRRWSAR